MTNRLQREPQHCRSHLSLTGLREIHNYVDPSRHQPPSGRSTTLWILLVTNRLQRDPRYCRSYSSLAGLKEIQNAADPTLTNRHQRDPQHRRSCPPLASSRAVRNNFMAVTLRHLPLPAPGKVNLPFSPETESISMAV